MGRLYLLLALCLLNCCGLFGSETEKITINTTNGKLANCTLKNAAGVWQTPTNQPVEVKKSATDLKIRCSDKTLRAYKVVKTDAVHDYPSTIVVSLKAKKRDSDVGLQPKEEDDNATNDEDDDGARPLNMLPEGTDNDNDKE